MTTLSEKSRENLRILKNLGENDILSSFFFTKISIQEEFVEVDDNIRELENGLYFTFHQCHLRSSKYGVSRKRRRY